MKKNAYIIIPARLGSKRLPNKILLNKTGKYLLLHTLESALKSKLAKDVFIATDSQEVIDKISPYYKKIYLVNGGVKSGTQRCYQLAKKLNLPRNSYIINWQADEPQLNAKYVDQLLKILSKTNYRVATLIAPSDIKKYMSDPNTVKVLINNKNEAIFFFRKVTKEIAPYVYFHIGLYIYTYEFLEKFMKLKSKLEDIFKLEQLRIIENGEKILTYTIEEFHKGIDTISDYNNFIKTIKTT